MKSRIIFLTTCLMTLATFAGFGTGVAHAYDERDCDRMFGSADVEKVRKFNLNRNLVDFGDELHLGGVPQGHAVICWSIDGRVAVKGKLYSDNFHHPQTATVRIRFRRISGTWTNWTTRTLNTNGGWVSNREIEKVSPVGQFNKVRIRLKYFTHTGLGFTSAYVANVYYDR